MSTSQENTTSSTAPRAVEPVLVAEHLYKIFPVSQINPFAPARGIHAVEDATLSLYSGRVTALVGESGSDKTTIARMLVRIYDPTSGTIRFRGQPIKLKGGKELRSYRQNVQMVFQDPFASINPVHGIRYTLGRPLRVYGHVKNDAEETENVMALLKKVSLLPADQFIQKFPHQLSALPLPVRKLPTPVVLLADEPVSMLDVSIRLERCHTEFCVTVNYRKARS